MPGHDAAQTFYYHQGRPFPDYVFLRGDGNRDGATDISDVIALSAYLFQNAASECPAQLDVTADEKIDITDPMALIDFLFLGGSPPEAPFPECDEGPETDLACLEFVCL